MNPIPHALFRGSSAAAAAVIFAAILWATLLLTPESVSEAKIFWLVALVFSLILGFVFGVHASRQERGATSVVALIDQIAAAPQQVAQADHDAWLHDERIVRHTLWASQSVAKLVEKLQHHSQQNDRVLENMVDGVIVVDENSRVIGLNPAARRLLQISTDDVLQRPLLDIVRLPEVVEAVDRVLREQRFQELTFSFGQSDRRWVRVLAAPLTAAPRPGVVVTLHDETRLRALEELRREFVANVSHELKTPLASVKGYSETLLMGALEDPSASRRFVEIISQQADRLERLIDDMLRLARAQGGPEVLNLSDVPLRGVLSEAVNNYRPVADRKPLTLQLEPVAPSLLVRADREALLTIVNNLVGNAVRYTPEGGQVKVAAERCDQKCLISVTDDGPGIPEVDRQRIFERFYRVEKGRDSRVAGTGLGLAIAKNLVTNMKGTIELESTLGAGSCFRVYLPASDAQPKSAAGGG